MDSSEAMKPTTVYVQAATEQTEASSESTATASESSAVPAMGARETVLMWLMPLSQLLSWAAMILWAVDGRSPMGWLCCVSGFYWLWVRARLCPALNTAG